MTKKLLLIVGLALFMMMPIAATAQNYVRTHGTSWFDTGVKPTAKTKIELDMLSHANNVPSGTFSTCGIMGAATASHYSYDSGLAIYAFCDATSSPIYSFLEARSGNNGVSTNYNLRNEEGYRITFKDRYFDIKYYPSLEEYENATWTNSGGIDCDRTIYLGWINCPEMSGNDNNKYDMSIFACRVYESDELIHEFVPSRYNGKIGMIDKVTGTFKSMSGTGATMSVGDCNHWAKHEVLKDKNGKEQAYRHCQLCDTLIKENKNYVANNGTAYFDTKYIPSRNTMVKMDFSIEKLIWNKYQYVLGIQDDSDGVMRDFVKFNPKDADFYYGSTYFYTKSTDKKVTPNLSGFDFTITPDLWLMNRYDMQDQKDQTFSSAIVPSKLDFKKRSIKLGFYNLSDNDEAAANMSIYECDIMENGILVHQFLPARFNGEWGLFDTKTQAFNPMTGKGAYGYVDSHTCKHEYTIADKSKGLKGNHCLICDAFVNPRYYYDVVFNKNATDAYGIMGNQEIDTRGNLASLEYKRANYMFAGWSLTPSGEPIYKDGDEIVADENHHGELLLYAQWIPTFTVNGEAKLLTDENTREINIVDDATNGFSTAKEFTAGAISYVRNLDASAEWGTLCLPFAIQGNSDVTLYQPSEVVDDKMYLTQVEKAEAGEPVIFRKNTAGATSISFSASDASIAILPLSGGEAGNLSLVGSFTYDPNIRCTEGTEYYVISNNVFYRVKSNIVLSPYRAYFTQTSSSAAKDVLYPVEDTSGISSTEQPYIRTTATYNLNGMRVDKDYKGIVIRNGKKYIAK